ncbi:MAG: c-type cytochrome [Campylobacteraceae bacterium]|jgi:ubiquinol-cytochrome c reductase cytochrome c1 subunit|nr:c-type cytochrome [Campylobacteraceae bacterium]
MKELKILAILILFTLITYIGIEPFAHTQMSPGVANANFDYEQEDIDLAKVRIEEAINALKKAEEKFAENTADENLQNAVESAKREVETRESDLVTYQELWAQANEIAALEGNTESGEELFIMACASCHGLSSQGIESPFDAALSSESYGVAVPDLSLSGAVYDKKFLGALIVNPAQALKVSKKFNDENPLPMTPFYGLEDDLNQETADIIAYLQSIAPQDVSDKEVFETACLRCHDMKYDAFYSPTEKSALKGYMGSNPPDLSMMIRSRLADYLENFINDPQKKLDGTAMPRVGLTKERTEQVISYLEKVGDSKKDERSTVGIGMIIFFVIMTFFAYMWKREVWRELH